MEWINLSIKRLSEADYRRSTLTDRGVWLTLLGYCVQQENGGCISGAESWRTDECRDVLGVARDAIEGSHLLWSFAAGDLLVSGYPIEKQREVDAKRRAARKGNRIRWQRSSHSTSHSDSHSESGKGNRKGKGKGIGKRKEGEDGEAHPRPSAPKAPLLSEVDEFFGQIGTSAEAHREAEKFFDHFEANGWRQGGRTPIRDWRAAARNWLRRSGEFAATGVGKNRVGGAVAEPFDSSKPNAHTGGLPVFNDEAGPPSAGHNLASNASATEAAP